ncbi:NACHT, LRR and PYD domains-containing protein 3-like isoform X3 [Triplophysa rosa]|uniref:NACHT, LRR and PYD domains-containing protein 3-like isoform X3 n=1 Tax=Triplophysa rosa TaxID=992332 RepID=UPI00254638D0|nr:NACHT, LRR and PYD domains-containing protein 3-like isoform X3 [Triplophysa rosa]
MASVAWQLVETLDELEPEKLKRFKWHLKQRESALSDKLENADVTDTVDQMLERFGEDGAVKITCDILKKMKHTQLAVQLETKEVPSSSVVVSSPVCSEISFGVNAETGASVNAPFISGNTFTGPVQMHYKDQQTPLVREAAKKHRRTQAGGSVLGILLQSFCPYQTDEFVLRKFLKNHKANMKRKTERVFESKKKHKVHLKNVYTELFITEADIEDVSDEHEIQKIEKCVKQQKSHNKPINYNDIFFSLGHNELNKTVLTKGIAGIGKTFVVRKFILDWAEGTANHSIDAMFLLPFGEINQIKDEETSFHEFLQKFYPEMKELSESMLYERKLLFIFDGLDESQLSLNFKCTILNSVNNRSSIDGLFINLIRGNLLPSSLIWITSRPAAANQIPPEFVGLFTEVQGFTDPQKEEYFRKRIKDENQASKIISHIKASRSLYIMCYIPVFCWIAATVLLDILIKNNSENIHTTLTEMYIHFLLIQMNMKNQKYDEEVERDHTKLLDSNRAIVLKLAKLAFEQLKKESTIFREEDLEECGIYVSEVSENTGIIAEIFKTEAGLHERRVFRFVHQSVQEFLAALHVFFCYMTKNVNELVFFFEERQDYILLHDLLKKAVNKAVHSHKGHLDLFLRFLLGLSLESNQKLLKGLLTDTEDSRESIRETIQYIKQFHKKHMASEASTNLTFCLSELKDYSLLTEIQTYGSPDVSPERHQSSSMCSALAYMIFMSGDVLDEFNPKLYETSPAGYMRLISAVRCCRKAIFSSCGLNDTCCKSVSSALQSSDSPLRDLDLSNNDLQDSGVKLISDALNNTNCQLEILRLALCNITVESCKSVSSALQSSNSPLRDLDVSNNDLQDSGVKLISDALNNTNCQLQTLRLSGCMVTDEGCCYLASALSSNPSHLRELDLSYNHPQHSELQLLAYQNDPNYALKILNFDHGGEFRIKSGLQKYAYDLTLDPNTANVHLVLSEENRKITRVIESQSYPDHPDRFDECLQVLCGESLTGRCYWEVDWGGREADVSVSYKGICREGRNNDCWFGYNKKSWSLICSPYRFTACHNNKKTFISAPSPPSNRVGVYVDWPAGTLSFYSVSDTHTLTHLHTFNTTFTQPLYAGFGVYFNSSVSLCKMTL